MPSIWLMLVIGVGGDDRAAPQPPSRSATSTIKTTKRTFRIAGPPYGSNVKICFQSFFMLMTIQPFFFASSYSAWVKVPTLVSGSPWAGP